MDEPAAVADWVERRVGDRKVADPRFDFPTGSSSLRLEKCAYFSLRPSSLSVVVALPYERLENKTSKGALGVGLVGAACRFTRMEERPIANLFPRWCHRRTVMKWMSAEGRSQSCISARHLGRALLGIGRHCRCASPTKRRKEKARARQPPVTIKSNTVLLYSLYYAQTYDEFTKFISASLRLGNLAAFEEMSQWWRAVGNILSDLTGPRFEPQTSRSVTNAFPLDQLADLVKNTGWGIVCSVDALAVILCDITN